MKTTCRSPEETELLGHSLGKGLHPGDLVCFFGDLGAGKTTMIKGIVAELGGRKEEVNSPTFVYLNIYEGSRFPIYHFDLYRLQNAEQFLSMGFDEYLRSDGVCLVEWSERVAGCLPPDAVHVSISHAGECNREVLVSEKVSV